jgi:hypothetical protein
LLDESDGADGSTILEPRMRAWLDRALQRGSAPFTSAQEAADAFAELPVQSESRELAETHDGFDAFNDLSDESDVRKPVPAASLITFPAEIPAPPEPLRPAPPVAEPAPFDVADLRATLERRQTTGDAPGATARRLSMSRIPEWIFAAVSLIALGEAIALMFMANDRRPADAANAVTPTAQTSVATPPVSPAPQVTSIPTNPQTAGAGPAAAAAASKAAEPTAAPIVRFGRLTIASVIDLQIFSDGTLVGSTPGSIELPEGSHNIKVVNATLEFQRTQSVSVKSGQMTSIRIAIPNGRVSLNATPWAEVTIDGAVVGETPMANYSLPIGTHTIVFRHPQLGERRQTVVVKATTIARVFQGFER